VTVAHATPATAKARLARRVAQADAWFEYSEACRNALDCSSLNYDEVEPWAWNRLQVKLGALDTRTAEQPSRP
jgi:hypothetical protein